MSSSRTFSSFKFFDKPENHIKAIAMQFYDAINHLHAAINEICKIEYFQPDNAQAWLMGKKSEFQEAQNIFSHALSRYQLNKTAIDKIYYDLMDRVQGLNLSLQSLMQLIQNRPDIDIRMNSLIKLQSILLPLIEPSSFANHSLSPK